MSFENIRVKRLVVEGVYALDIRLHETQRCFILEGENSSGKTTFVKLILFGLGAEVTNFIPELRRSNFVLLEVILDNEPFTFKRYLNTTPNLIQACSGSLNTFADASSRTFAIGEGPAEETFQDFIMGKLGMRDRQLIVRSTGEITRLSWTQLLALSYVDQYTDASLVYWSTGTRSEPVEIKRKRMETVFNLNFEQVDKLEGQRSTINRLHAQHERELKGALRFVQDFGLDDKAGLLQTASTLSYTERHIGELRERISTAKVHMKTESTHLDSIRLEIGTLGGEIQGLETEILMGFNRINDYQRLLNDIDQEQDRVDIVQAVQANLSGIAVTSCPNCLQTIPPIPSHQNTCYVCHQPLPHEEDIPADLELELADKARDVTAALSYQQATVQRLTHSREELTQAKANREARLNQLTAELIAPFLTDLEENHERLRSLERQRDELMATLKAFEQTERYRQQLKRLSADLSQINASLRQLRSLITKQLPRYVGQLVEALDDFLKDIMPDLQSVTLEQTSFLPIVNERDITHLDSASDRVIVRLGFMYAVLALAIRADVKHPRLLLLDSPRDKDLDRHRFAAIMNKFRALAEASPVDCQIIITTSEVPGDLSGCTFLHTAPTPDHYLLRRAGETPGDARRHAIP